MAKDIAVFVGENGKTASLYEKGQISVYQRKMGKWSIQREKEFSLDKSLGMKDLREKMADALDFLKDCKIFVGLSVTGVPYFELEKSLFSVWEFEGKPMEFLDYVLEEEEGKPDQELNEGKNNRLFTPVEISNGCYRISLSEIQEKGTGVTSKQVLLPFLRKGVFYSLEVVCKHVPPWLQAELYGGDFSGEIEETSSGEVKIMITRSCRQSSLG